MDVRMRSGVPRASKQAIEAASRMEKKIGEAEKKGRTRSGLADGARKGHSQGGGSKREETRTRRVTRHANIGFSRTFGPSVRGTFIRRFISVMRMNASGPGLYRDRVL